MDVENALGLIFVASLVGGFSLLVALGIARQVARQRIAENLLRERLALAWGRARPERDA